MDHRGLEPHRPELEEVVQAHRGLEPCSPELEEAVPRGPGPARRAARGQPPISPMARQRALPAALSVVIKGIYLHPLLCARPSTRLVKQPSPSPPQTSVTNPESEGACDRFQAGGLPKATGLAAELALPSGAHHRLLKAALGLTPQRRCSKSGSSNRDTKNTKSAHSTLGPRGRTPCCLVSIGWVSQLASEPKGGLATGEKVMGFAGWKPGLPGTLLHGPREAWEQEWVRPRGWWVATSQEVGTDAWGEGFASSLGQTSLCNVRCLLA